MAMSRPLHCLNSSMRSLVPMPSGSVLSPARTTQATRRCLHTPLRSRPGTRPFSSSRSMSSQRLLAENDDPDSQSMGGASGAEQLTSETDRRPDEALSDNQGFNGYEREVSLPPENESHFAEHLNGLFHPLQFPPELARRILTHASHPAAINGHNAGLSFMGRRVLESYLLLFLSSSPALQPTHDLELICSRALNTYVLGEHVGPIWGLGRALRWTPTVPARLLKPDQDQKALLRNVGLYKVQGDAVNAVMGGMFHQFGGSVAHRVFHTRLLPHILLGRKADGLPEAFHEHAHAVCNNIGGKEGKLILDRPAPHAPTIALSNRRTVPKRTPREAASIRVPLSI